MSVGRAIAPADHRRSNRTFALALLAAVVLPGRALFAQQVTFDRIVHAAEPRNGLFTIAAGKPLFAFALRQ